MADVTISQLTNTVPTSASILPISKDGVTFSTTLAQLSSLPFIPKAWVSFNGSSATINSSYNVQSVVRNGTGIYTIYFSTPMRDNKYVVNVTANTNTGSGISVYFAQSPTVESVVIGAGYDNVRGAYYDCNPVYIVIYGN